MVEIQPKFKADLLDSVEVFQHDVGCFTDDYLTVGVALGLKKGPIVTVVLCKMLSIICINQA